MDEWTISMRTIANSALLVSNEFVNFDMIFKVLYISKSQPDLVVYPVGTLNINLLDVFSTNFDQAPAGNYDDLKKTSLTIEFVVCTPDPSIVFPPSYNYCVQTFTFASPIVSLKDYS